MYVGLYPTLCDVRWTALIITIEVLSSGERAGVSRWPDSRNVRWHVFASVPLRPLDSNEVRCRGLYGIWARLICDRTRSRVCGARGLSFGRLKAANLYLCAPYRKEIGTGIVISLCPGFRWFWSFVIG